MTDLQILYFLKVAQHMSYTAAARELFITQPSLSKQISALERELGTPLFDRSRKNRLALTPAGRLYQKTFQQSAEAFRDTMRQVELQQKHRAMELRLGIGAGWDWGVLTARCSEVFRERYPEARITWQVQSFFQLRRMLSANELDVIFCTQTGLDSFEGVVVRPVVQTEATLYYGAAQSPAVDLGQFRDQVLYVLPPEEAPLSTDINRGYLSAWQMRPPVEVLPNRDSILLALSNGGFTVLDNMMTYRNNSLYRVMPLGQAIPICAVWKERNPSPLIAPVTEWMERELTERFGGWDRE